MKIKLIQPAMIQRPMDTKLKTRMAPSLALLTLANLTPKEHEVIIENENVESINFDEKVDLVAITVTVDVMNRAIEIAKEFKKRSVKVVAGGIHITADPKGAYGYFDAICVGMAERIWQRILFDAQNDSLKEIYNDMVSISGQEIVSPNYDIIDNSKYLYTNIISTSRGCPFECDFCYNSSQSVHKAYINRPIEDVIREIKTLRTRHIMFIDDNFIGNPSWTKKFLAQIKPLGLKYNAAVTSNIVDMPDILDDLKESGCQSLFIGFESINDKAIDSVNKVQNSVGKFKNIIKRLPSSKKQWIPYLAFNLLYRRFGKLTEKVCEIISFRRVGSITRWFSYNIK